MSHTSPLQLVPKGGDRQKIKVSSKIEISVQHYLVSRKQKGYSARTVEAYHWHLARLSAWLMERGVLAPNEIIDDLLLEWGASLFDSWQSATVKQAVLAARGWLRWCYDKHLIDDEILISVLEVPKLKRRIQRTLWADEIEALQAACDLSTVRGMRDAALVSLLVDSGLRAAEICRLQWSDLNLERRELKVVVKGGDERRGYFGDETVARLKMWRSVQPVREGVNTVFSALGGTRRNKKTGKNESGRGYPLTTHGLRRLLSNLGKAAGVAGVSPHAFRRAFVVLLTEAGANDGMIQEWGRWQSESMVKLYRQAYQSESLYPKYTPTDFLKRKKTVEH